MRGVTNNTPHRYNVIVFQLTRLMRGVTLNAFCASFEPSISTHTPHARRDFFVLFLRNDVFQFQLTRLMRGVTGRLNAARVRSIISTHTPHARRDKFCYSDSTDKDISTHTPHARRDLLLRCPVLHLCISTHTPHARRDEFDSARLKTILNFNSHASCEA